MTYVLHSRFCMFLTHRSIFALVSGGGSTTRGTGAGARFAATFANVRRVKVTNRDGSQQVVELSDEGGLSPV